MKHKKIDSIGRVLNPDAPFRVESENTFTVRQGTSTAAGEGVFAWVFPLVSSPLYWCIDNYRFYYKLASVFLLMLGMLCLPVATSRCRLY